MRPTPSQLRSPTRGASPGAKGGQRGCRRGRCHVGVDRIIPRPSVQQGRGTSVVLRLKPELNRYSKESTVEAMLKKYSNFIGFPIFLKVSRVNTIDVVWLQESRINIKLVDTHSSNKKQTHTHAHTQPVANL